MIYKNKKINEGIIFMAFKEAYNSADRYLSAVKNNLAILT